MKNYEEKFQDPSNNSWAVSHNENIYSITTPNKSTFTIKNNQVDFSQEFKEQPQSARMWLLSLGFLVHIKEEDCTEILNEFLKQSSRDPLSKILDSFSSMDHSAAVRIRTMCIIHQRATSEELKRLASDIAIKTSEWGIQEGNLVSNNHGMMLAIALLHCSEIINPENKEKYESTAFNFLRSLFSRVFGQTFFANENTIGYHEFYCKTIKQLNQYLSISSHDKSHVNYFSDLEKNIYDTLYRIVHQDGSIPPIGDSGFYPTKYQTINGVFFDESNGFLVKKTDTTYLSFICGSSSETHKQMDDTSITIRKNNTDFIIDSGLYNYDINDAKRRLMNSQRAHSGIFFRNLDWLTRREFKEQYIDHRASLRKIDDSIYIGINSFSNSIISREIDISSDSLICFNDTFISNEHRDIIQRFIIPNEATISIKRNFIEIENNSEKILILFEYSFEAVINTPTNSDRGYASSGFNKSNPVQCLEISPVNSINNFKFKIIV